jgi:phosphoribosylaminoimidazole (AIR) synthetase
MGIGMVLVVDRGAEEEVIRALEEAGEHATTIGQVTAGSNEVTIL